MNHSKESLKKAATAAKVAYKDERYIKLFYYDHKVHFFSHNGTQAFVAADDSEIIISFRGTNSPLDWLRNADFRFKGNLHSGFSYYENQVSADVYLAAKQLRTNNQKFLVTGHSLGGAASTIWCSNWLTQRIIPMEHITFGSPRPGNKAFAKKFNKIFGDISLRVTNGSDLVPHLPTTFPKWLDLIISIAVKLTNFPVTPGKFRHAQKKHLHFKANGQILTNPSKYCLWRDFLVGILSDFGIKGFAGIKNHSMDIAYTNKIREFL